MWYIFWNLWPTAFILWFSNCIFPKCIFPKCTRLMHHLSLASLLLTILTIFQTSKAQKKSIKTLRSRSSSLPSLSTSRTIFDWSSPFTSSTCRFLKWSFPFLTGFPGYYLTLKSTDVTLLWHAEWGVSCLKSVQSVRSLEGKLEPLRCNWISGGEALPVAAGPYLEDTWLTRSSNHYFTHALTHFRSLAFPRESQITTCVFRMLSTESHKVEICRPSHNLSHTFYPCLELFIGPGH